MKVMIVWIVLLLYGNIVSGQVFEEQGECYDRNKTPNEAKWEAKLTARKRIVERAGTELSSVAATIYTESSDRPLGEIFSEFTRSTARGVITDEEILLDTMINVDNYPKFVVRIKAKVEIIPRDRSLSIELSLDKQNYLINEEVTLRCRPNFDCYITIFSFTADNSVSVLLPNKYMRSNRLSKGVETEMPSRLDRKRGVSFAVDLPPGVDETSEGYLVVATQDSVPFFSRYAVLKGGQMIIENRPEAWLEINRWLAGLGDKRAEAAQTCAIRRK